MSTDAKDVVRRFTDNKLARCKVERGEGDDAPARIAGYASVFYDADDPGTEFEIWPGAVERIMPGTFTRALAEKDDVMGLFNHSGDKVLGRTESGTMRLKQDKVGLFYEIDPPDTPTAAEVIQLVERGDVDGSSFAFIVTDDEWRTEEEVEIREISGVRLFDVGPVVWPAYKASTTGLRGLVDCTEARSSHDAWQAALEELATARRAARSKSRSRQRRLKMCRF